MKLFAATRKPLVGLNVTLSNAGSLRDPKFGSTTLSGLYDNLHIMAKSD